MTRSVARELAQVCEPRLQHLVICIAQNPLTDADSDLRRLQRALGREQPLFVLVLFAGNHRRIDEAVQFLADLGLNQSALFFDDNHEIEPLHELTQRQRLQRPRHGDFVETDAKISGAHLVDAQFIKSLAGVEIAFPGADNADPGRRPAAPDHLVQPVSARKRQHRVALEVVQPRLAGHRRINEADVQPALRHGEVRRQFDFDAPHPAIADGRRLHIVLDAF